MTLSILALEAGAAAKPIDLALKDAEGRKVRLRDYRGKIVILNFWATWCGPCKAEIPLLVDMEREFAPKGVIFIAASLDEEKARSTVLEFIKRYAIAFPVWFGATIDHLDRLQMSDAVPATAFVDSEGEIVARVSGAITREELRERLEWLLTGKPSPAPKSFVSHIDR